MEVSGNLGRGSHKERYAYVYRYTALLNYLYNLATFLHWRNETVEVLQTYQYNDSTDSFQREPFSILIRSRESSEESQSLVTQCNSTLHAELLLKSFSALHAFSDPLEFFLLGVHIKPTCVCSELEALEMAYLDTSSQFDDANGLMMGDFNAACRYYQHQ